MLFYLNINPNINKSSTFITWGFTWCFVWTPDFTNDPRVLTLTSRCFVSPQWMCVSCRENPEGEWRWGIRGSGAPCVTTASTAWTARWSVRCWASPPPLTPSLPTRVRSPPPPSRHVLCTDHSKLNPSFYFSTAPLHTVCSLKELLVAVNIIILPI